MTLRDDLDRDEGNVLFVYDDATGKRLKKGMKLVGNPTIGRGRNLSSRGISAHESDAMLDSDISSTRGELAARLPHWRTYRPAWQDALTNMAFNMGTDGLLGFKKMLACLDAGDGPGAAAEVLDSKAAEQLPERYARIADAFRKG